MRRVLALLFWPIALPALAQTPVNPIWNPISNPNYFADQTVQQLGQPTLYADFAHGFYEGCPTPTTCWTSSGPTGYVSIPGWTFTRASAGLAQNSSGVFQSFASGVPRVTDLGLLVEGTSTNVITNNTATGAVTGSPGTVPTGWANFSLATGITQTVVGSGTEGGLPYLDLQFQGTTSVSAILFTGDTLAPYAAASAGQVWTSSVYMKLQAGSLSGVALHVQAQVFSGQGTGFIAGGSDPSPFAPNGNLLSSQHFISAPYTLPASTNFVTQAFFGAAPAGTYNFTLRVAGCQLEQQAFASSPILTTSAAVTRAADVAYVSGVTTPAAFTFFTDVVGANSPTPSGYPSFSGLSDGTFANYFTIAGSPGNSNVGSFEQVGSVTKISATVGTTPLANQPMRLAFSTISSGYSGANGLSNATGSYVTLPASRIDIGQGPTGSNYQNAFTKNVSLWPIAASATQLQALTQGGSQ